MRFWVDARPGEDMDAVGNGVRIGFTRSYYEWELAHPDCYEFVYVIPRGLKSISYAVSWKRAFDSLGALRSDQAFRREMAVRWPAISRLLDDAKPNGGVVTFEDYDTGEPSWFVISTVDGVDPAHPNTWGAAGVEAQSVVRSASLIMLEELATSSFSAGRPVLVDLWRSFADGLQLPLAKPSGPLPSPYPFPHPSLSPRTTPPILDWFRTIDRIVKG